MSCLYEPDALRERYTRRESQASEWCYQMLNPSVWQCVQERRQRATFCLRADLGWRDPSRRRVPEVGCESGGDLTELPRDGFDPAHLQGIELLEDRFQDTRSRLLTAVHLMLSDVCEAGIPAANQDTVLQSTVYSSSHDVAFRQRLANVRWRVCPGGSVLWYDFTVDNSHNPDGRGASMRRAPALFPRCRVRSKHTQLAPPIARRVMRVHPALYTQFNAVLLLRAHVLAWIEKPLNS